VPEDVFQQRPRESDRITVCMIRKNCGYFGRPCMPGPIRYGKQRVPFPVAYVRVSPEPLPFQFAAEECFQRIVRRLVARNSNPTLLSNPVRASVCVVHEKRVNSNRLPVQAELGQPVEQLLYRQHQYFVRVNEFVRRQFWVGGASCDTELSGLLTGLRDQEVVRAQVNRWPFPRIESRLKHQQANERFPLTRMKLYDDVPSALMIAKPTLKDS
jgi:hypothetical protein